MFNFGVLPRWDTHNPIENLLFVGHLIFRCTCTHEIHENKYLTKNNKFTELLKNSRFSSLHVNKKSEQNPIKLFQFNIIKLIRPDKSCSVSGVYSRTCSNFSHLYSLNAVLSQYAYYSLIQFYLVTTSVVIALMYNSILVHFF